MPSPRFASPSGGFFVHFKGVLDLGPDDVWISGGPPPEIAHWDGTHWTSYAVPNGNSQPLSSIVALSPGDIWAAGDGVTVEWNGSWRLTALYSVYQGFEVEPITMRNDELWGISGAGHQMVRWNGTAWAPIGRPYQNICLNGLAAAQNGDVWAVGIYPGNHARPAILHYRC
jgi:hypothetical protein